MRLKHRPEDFIVRERSHLPDPAGQGQYGVYSLKKRKLSTQEAVDLIARRLRIDKRDIAISGLKDRQSVSEQQVSFPGPPQPLELPDLTLTYLGRSQEPVSAEQSQGNAFDITIRDCALPDLRALERAVEPVRSEGLPNYFDDQRFACLRTGQGFVARELLEGKFEEALKAVIGKPLALDSQQELNRKQLIARMWGRWDELLDILGTAKHAACIRHLVEQPRDFAGAFLRLGRLTKTIHLFAYQSFLWNLAVSRYLHRILPADDRSEIPSSIGPLAVWKRLPRDLAVAIIDNKMTFPLPAPGIRPQDGRVAKAITDVLAREGLTLSKLRIPAEGLFFKSEDRLLALRPERLQVGKSEYDPAHKPNRAVSMSFALPRGSYATLVVKRLFMEAPGIHGLRAPDSRRGGWGAPAAQPRNWDRDADRSGSRPDRGGPPRGGSGQDRPARPSRGDRPSHAGANPRSGGPRQRDGEARSSGDGPRRGGDRKPFASKGRPGGAPGGSGWKGKPRGEGGSPSRGGAGAPNRAGARRDDSPHHGGDGPRGESAGSQRSRPRSSGGPRTGSGRPGSRSGGPSGGAGSGGRPRAGSGGPRSSGGRPGGGSGGGRPRSSSGGPSSGGRPGGGFGGGRPRAGSGGPSSGQGSGGGRPRSSSGGPSGGGRPGAGSGGSSGGPRSSGGHSGGPSRGPRQGPGKGGGPSRGPRGGRPGGKGPQRGGPGGSGSKGSPRGGRGGPSR